jgi:hypothetical protein
MPVAVSSLLRMPRVGPEQFHWIGVALVESAYPLRDLFLIRAHRMGQIPFHVTPEIPGVLALG